MEVTSDGDNKWTTAVVKDCIGAAVPKSWLLSGRRLPRPIRVGDRVERMGTKASVVAIDGPEAWVKFDGYPDNTTVFLSSLTPIPGDEK